MRLPNSCLVYDSCGPSTRSDLGPWTARPTEGEKVAIPIAGDDEEAVRIASELVVDAGFDPVVVGGLSRAREFDQGSAVYVRDMTAAELREALGLG